MEIKKNVFYQLSNQNSAKVADIYSSSTDDNAQMVQYSSHEGADQQFLFFKLDNNCYAVANKNSGKVMDVYSSSKDDNANLVQYYWHGSSNQQWLPIELPDNSFNLQNNNSGKVMDVYSSSKDDNAHLVQYHSHEISNQQWSFLEGENFSLPSIATDTLPDVPQYTTLNDNLSDTTPVITAYTLIPCIMVNDSWDETLKIQSTPYYMLYKKQYWKNIDSHTFAPYTTNTSITTYGMNNTDQQNMEETTGISVTADAGFSFGPISTSISGTVTEELKVGQSTTTELMTTQENDETISNDSNSTVAWTKFALVSEYYLARADGTNIGSSPWVVINKNDERESYYPLDANLQKNVNLQNK
ncbi:RICIN domain-containing protein [Bacillus mycoides]|uniref:RICIN domain-containing protein n=1 Tax=Bacillus mycoides TaxID=1405 RepID=UPI00065BABEE|nr:RICIN domain-containing protein [Bacillus mycoides]KMQ16236.1 hypothetical protein TU70_16220 [Bacillus mycoides]